MYEIMVYYQMSSERCRPNTPQNDAVEGTLTTLYHCTSHYISLYIYVVSLLHLQSDAGFKHRLSAHEFYHQATREELWILLNLVFAHISLPKVKCVLLFILSNLRNAVAYVLPLFLKSGSVALTACCITLPCRIWPWPHTDPKAPGFPEDSYEIARHTFLKVRTLWGKF